MTAALSLSRISFTARERAEMRIDARNLKEAQMSGTQTASTTTAQPTAAVIANGKGKRAAPKAAAQLPAEPVAAAAQPQTQARTMSPAQIAARAANLAKGRESRAAAARASQAGISGANSLTGAAARQPAGPLESPVIQGLVRMLPAQGATFSQRQAVTWLEACAANIRLIYGFTGSITVTGTPAAA